MRSCFIFILIMANFLLVACTESSKGINSANSEEDVVDYSELSNWALITNSPVHDADIFYIHPTTYNDNSALAERNWEIDSESDPALYIYCTILSQVSIFNDIANPFVPYYRQMNINICFQEGNEKEFAIAYSDTKAAFEYYFENHNEGRPFFILGHSQGAHIGLELIKELFTDKKYLNKLIAAYIVGWPITQTELNNNPHIKVLGNPTETGGIVAWDVVSENVTAIFPTVAPDSIIVNPLTWTITSNEISSDKNLGSVFYGVVGDDYLPLCNISGFTGAQVKTMPPVPGYFEFEYEALVTPDLTQKLIDSGEEIDSYALSGSYHVQAVNLFYENIRQNAIARKTSFHSTFDTLN